MLRPIFDTERTSTRRGSPPISISIGRVMSFSTSSGDMPPAFARICTCTVVTSGKASIGMRCQDITPKATRTAVPIKTSIRWRTENSRMSLIISIGLHLALQQFRFENETAGGHDLLVRLHPFEHLHATVLLQAQLHDAFLKLISIKRNKNNLIFTFGLQCGVGNQQNIFEHGRGNF